MVTNSVKTILPLVVATIGALVFHEPTVKTDLCHKGYPEYDE